MGAAVGGGVVGGEVVAVVAVAVGTVAPDVVAVVEEPTPEGAGGVVGPVVAWGTVPGASVSIGGNRVVDVATKVGASGGTEVPVFRASASCGASPPPPRPRSSTSAATSTTSAANGTLTSNRRRVRLASSSAKDPATAAQPTAASLRSVDTAEEHDTWVIEPTRAAHGRRPGARLQERRHQAHGRGHARRGARRASGTPRGRRGRHHQPILTSLGVGVTREGDALTVAPHQHARAPRSRSAFTGLNRIPILLLGPLLHRVGEAFVPLVGGDPIGRRPDRLPRRGARGHGRRGRRARRRHRGQGRAAARRQDRAAVPERRWPPRPCCCPRCWPRARPCCATPPPSPRSSSWPCSSSAWAPASSCSPTAAS